jgi:rare lipoprotein A
MRRAERIAGGGLAPLAVTLLLSLALAGCGGSPKRGVELDGVPGAQPRVEPKARYGNMKSYVVFGKTYYPKTSSRGHVERGIASWYGPKFHGKKTSSGEPYDMHQWTAAHKTLPLPTYALVTNLENGRHLIVKINDRGPFVGDRIIDLSYAAAKELGVDKKGTALVQVTSIDPRDHEGDVPKTLKIADAALASDRARRAGGGAPAATARRSTPPKPATETVARDTRTVAKPQAPDAMPAAAPARRPQAQPAVAGTGGGYYLQVGAFGARANAEQMRRRLGGQLTAPVTVADPAMSGADARALYRVRVGPVGSRVDAERLAGELAALGIGPSLVVSH